MDKRDVIEFFDRCAPTWDAEQPCRDGIIHTILDKAGIGAGMKILDVACGTGIMFPYYIERGAASVTGVDIAPEMAKLAAAKFASEPSVKVVCGDVEEICFDKKFDAVVIYNAFPHFPEPQRLLDRLAEVLVPGGTLTVAHGMSREQINAHHRDRASKVSNGLMEAEELAEMLKARFDVKITLSDETMYQVTGVKK